MTVESASFISQLNSSLPAAGDLKSEGDDHMRLIKSVLQGQFPSLGATAVTAIAAEINGLVGSTTTGATAFKVVTQVLSDNGLNAASTAFVQGLVSAAIGSGSAAPVWVSGTTYAVGNTVYSPITFQTYRRKVAGAGTTDPSLDTTNWQVLSSTIGTGGQAITGNYTFTASSAAAITVTPSAPGQYLTFDAATTFSKADNIVSAYNAGDYDYGVKDSTGTQLGWIRARTGAMVGLSDNSTAAGVWVPYGLEKTGITASYVNSTLANMGSTIRRIALDANRTCFLFGGTDCYAIVYDASSQTWGSATLVRASVASGGFLGVLSTTNQVLVVSNDSTTAMEAVTLTISGTGITVNTGSKGTATLGGNWAAYGQLIAVGSSFVVSYGRATTTSAIRAITVSGTVPTIGAESALTTANGGNTAIALFSAGSVVRCVHTQSSALRVSPYTVSGSTLTIGTLASVTTTAAPFRAFLNGNGNIVCHYIDGTHFATIFKLTGTVEAASSVSLGTAPSTLSTDSDYVAVTASKTLFISHSASTTWRANVLTDSSGTATAGTEINGTVNGNIFRFAGLLASGNNARCAMQTANTNGVNAQFTFDCSGASPVLSTVQQCGFGWNGATGIAFPAPYVSDKYGVRDPSSLIAGQSAVTLAGGAGGFDLRWNAASIGKAVACMSQGATYQQPIGIVGSSNSESFLAIAYNNSITGYIINRVEAAA
jgi:hypothetical protein